MNTGNFGHDRMKLHIVQNKILEANEYQHEQKCSRIKAAKTLKKCIRTENRSLWKQSIKKTSRQLGMYFARYLHKILIIKVRGKGVREDVQRMIILIPCAALSFLSRATAFIYFTCFIMFNILCLFLKVKEQVHMPC